MAPSGPASPPAPKPYPGFAQSLLVLFLSALFGGLTGLPALVLLRLKLQPWAAWAMLLGQLGGLALTLKVCLAMGKKAWSDAFPSRPVPIGVWPFALVSAAGLILVTNGIDAWMSHLLPPPASYWQMFSDFGWQGVVVGAPLAEEPLFRGLILGGFVRRYGAGKAILYSALLFGFIHMNPWQFPGAALSGLLLGWLTLRTGSLWPAVAAHFLNNLSVTLARGLHLPFLWDGRFQPLWMWGLGLLLIGLGLAALERRTRGASPTGLPQTVPLWSSRSASHPGPAAEVG